MGKAMGKSYGQATVQGVSRIGYDLATKSPPPKSCLKKKTQVYPKPHFSFLQNSLQHSPALGEPWGPNKAQGLFSKYLTLSLYNQVLILVFVFVF